MATPFEKGRECQNSMMQNKSWEHGLYEYEMEWTS